MVQVLNPCGVRLWPQPMALDGPCAQRLLRIRRICVGWWQHAGEPMSTTILTPPPTRQVIPRGPMPWDEFVAFFRYLEWCGRQDTFLFTTELEANRFMVQLADRIGEQNLHFIEIFRERTLVTLGIRNTPV